VKADLSLQRLLTRVGRIDINVADVRRGAKAAVPGAIACVAVLAVLGFGAIRAQGSAKTAEMHLAQAQAQAHWSLSQRTTLTDDRERLQRIRTMLIDQHEDVRTTLAPLIRLGNVLPSHVRLTNVAVAGRSITITDGEAFGYRDLEATRASLRRAGYQATIATGLPPDSAQKATMTWTGSASE
jgi:hypothetical protein